MKSKKNGLYLQFDNYTVRPADEAEIIKTVEAGQQLILQSHTQRLGFTHRIFNQIKYISPLLWGIEAVVLVLCVWLVSQTDINTDITLLLSSLSFWIAILGVFGFPELCKSFSLQMWELEQSCKYNLRQVVTLKLAILGTLDLILVVSLAMAVGARLRLPLWEVALYLLTPFNLSCIVAFYSLGILRDKESRWQLFLVGGTVAFLILICVNRFSLYQTITIPAWIVVYTLSLAVLVGSAVHFIKNVEQGGMFLCS